MSDELLEALAPFGEWAHKLLTERPQLACLVRDVGKLLVALTQTPVAPAAAPPAPAVLPIAPPVVAPAPPPPPPPIVVAAPAPPAPPAPPQRFLSVAEAFPALHPPI